MTEYTAAAESPIDKAQAGPLHRNRKGLSPCQGVNFFDCLVPTSYLEIQCHGFSEADFHSMPKQDKKSGCHSTTIILPSKGIGDLILDQDDV